MNTIDIAIPCYKYGHFLEECLRSVLSQEGVEVRCLMIDDASPDGTEEVGRRLAAEDPRVDYCRHAINQGHIATFNQGIEWASADYFIALSADDVLMPGALYRAATLMNDHPEVVMIHGRGLRTTDPRKEAVTVPQAYNTRVIRGEKFWEQSCIAAGNIVSIPTAVVRTSTQKAIGGYRKDLPMTADMELWLRFAAHGHIGFIDTYQAYYRIHDQNLTFRFAAPDRIRQEWGAFEILFGDYGRGMAHRDLLEAGVRSLIGWNAFWCASAYFDLADAKRCAECYELALTLWPQIRGSRAWYRYQCKKAVGAKVWRQLQPMANKLRGRDGVEQSVLDPLPLVAQSS